jgi:hypothetical protein
MRARARGDRGRVSGIGPMKCRGFGEDTCGPEAVQAVAAVAVSKAVGVGTETDTVGYRNEFHLLHNPRIYPRLHPQQSTGAMASRDVSEDLPGLNNKLAEAALAGDVTAVQALLADGRADPAASWSVALRYAAYYGHVTIVQALLADGRADPAADNSSALRLAVRNGNASVVQVLLDDGRADPAAGKSAALRQAAYCGHAAILQVLLADGRADPAADNSSALRLTVRNGNASVVQVLLDDGRADPAAYVAGCSSVLTTALWYAAESGHADIVQALLDDGRVDFLSARVYGNLVRAMNHTSAATRLACQPVTQCLERRKRWQHRRPWLRACQ